MRGPTSAGRRPWWGGSGVPGGVGAPAEEDASHRPRGTSLGPVTGAGDRRTWVCHGPRVPVIPGKEARPRSVQREGRRRPQVARDSCNVHVLAQETPVRPRWSPRDGAPCSSGAALRARGALEWTPYVPSHQGRESQHKHPSSTLIDRWVARSSLYLKLSEDFQ